jgi:CheY-like chemotaxis protein
MHSPDDIPPPTDPILVVDDEKIFLSALQQTLHRAGYPAVAHSSPLEALAELERRKFSVIISDQLMPELSGLELLANPAVRHPHSRHRGVEPGHRYRRHQQRRDFSFHYQTLAA